MAYLYLFIAVFLETAAAITTRFTDGFTVLLPTAITVVFSVSSYIIFSLSLKRGMNIGIGYAIWAGIGVLSVVLIGSVFLNDVLTLIQIGGVILVISGLAAIQLGGDTEEA
ncbi:multidrug efflux SMR transporter [Thalassobacillus sp. CUG 92003]|uniref:DMT family transporter n=1 Tax=Thalassobacillus sp. CUG 92003 TaxID=2736641 RepID=UPI0015E640E5|nr:SMR family transporter [Thalassobacillus sp. CUG 92003]